MPPAALHLGKVATRLFEKYSTPVKDANAARLHLQAITGEERVTAYPWRIILDPASGCNLKCPSCAGHEGSLHRGLLTLPQLHTYLRDLFPYLVQVNLFNWGEPFLNPRLPEIIADLHGRNIGTHVHTNGNHLPPGYADRIVASGLDFLIVSLDGVTQDTYATYRKTGRIDLALANLRALVAVKRRAKSDSPRIVWRYLCFPHNLHEIAAARKLAADIGVDDFTLGEGYLDGQVWTEHGPKITGGGATLTPLTIGSHPMPATTSSANPTATAAPIEPASGLYCTDLWDFPVIHVDGTLMPCCYVSTPAFFWSNLNTAPWLEAFNTPQFRAARRLSAGKLDTPSPCRSCFRIPAVAPAKPARARPAPALRA